MIRFFNTLSGTIEPFDSLSPGEVKLYTCGPTVYQFAHIGNFRAYMFEDLLKRFLIFMGYKVTHVMNITDVDDKTIREANKEGVTINQYTKRYIDAFFEDIKILRILKADYYPLATENIPGMVKMIKGLLEKGYAYRRGGSVYFDISKFPEYGRLSKINLSELKPGQRVDSDEYEKESLHDFALWKEKKEGEPFWETQIGPGRPGWHIECSVMSSKYLGETFDIHCGGVDNIFPHHENEIAQSQAYSGKKFVNTWLHCHHLIVNGEKMSKSKGNQYTLHDLLDRGINPLALRLLLLSTHYRKMLNFTFNAVDQTQSSLKRIQDFLYELKTRPFKDGKNADVSRLVDEAKKRFVSGLCDDLNIAVALTALFEMIKKVNILITEEKVLMKDVEKIISVLESFDRVLAIIPEVTEETLPREIMEMIEERDRARSEKKFALADEIRQKLLEKGIELEDTKNGVRWKTKKSS